VDIDKLYQTLAEILGEGPPALSGSDGPAGTSRVEGNQDLLCSSLPIEKPEYASIVCKFLDKLSEQLDAMDGAWSERDFNRLAQLAHWLKGSGANMGFEAFTVPAHRLEKLAQDEQPDEIESALAELRGLARRASQPATAATPAPHRSGGQPVAPRTGPTVDDSPLVSTLPTEKPQFAKIVRKFVGRLAEQLDAMDRALAAGNCQELAQLAHWLKGSGGNVGFGAFHEPALRLEQLAISEQVDQMESAIHELRRLAARIVPPTVDPPTESAGASGQAHPVSDQPAQPSQT
jgi:HPt (histidine-containing phosphotransfer) domain-containing protein